MKTPATHRFATGAFAALFFLSILASRAEVRLLRTPNHGIQPQAAVDEAGTLHLTYFKGEPQAGNIYYVKRPRDKEEFSPPIRVNHRDGSAIAIGTIRGAQLAVGKDHRVHVAWMGSSSAAQKDPGKPRPQHPMLYTRLNDQGTAFEPERNLVTWAGGLDGGGSIAADRLGNVYVAWHGSAPENREREYGRAVFVARSTDNGRTFSREKQANPETTGACGCCGMRAFVDHRSRVYMLYRTANPESRDMALLVSRDQGQSFALQRINRWKIQACPMSSASIGEGSQGAILGTEINGEIECDFFNPVTSELSRIPKDVLHATGKHPVVAGNSAGETLVAWLEGAGWAKGGLLRWQVLDPNRRPAGPKGRREGVAVWSLPAAVSLSDHEFLIIF